MTGLARTLTVFGDGLIVSFTMKAHDRRHVALRGLGPHAWRRLRIAGVLGVALSMTMACRSATPAPSSESPSSNVANARFAGRFYCSHGTPAWNPGLEELVAKHLKEAREKANGVGHDATGECRLERARSGP